MAIDQIQHLPVAPRGFTPEGVSPASLDPDTLYLVEHAIPPRLEGLTIFAHLLYYGTRHPETSIQYSLFQANGASQDEVIVLIRSVEALATSPGSPCGAETYLKVLLIFEALKIIRRTFHRNYTEIRIGLGKREIHIPSLLKELRQLHDTYQNKKVKQIAKKVAKRLQSGEFSQYQLRASSSLAPGLAPVAEILTHLLGKHGVENVDVPRLTEACTLVVQAVQTGRIAEKKGEFVGQRKDGSWDVRIKRGDSTTPSGEFFEEEREQGASSSSSCQMQTGEFVGKESPISVNQRPASVVPSRKNRPLRVKKGDFEAIFTTESPECVPTRTLLAELGEFNAGVSIIGQSLQVITSKREDTLIDTEAETRPYKDTRDIEEIRREAVFYESLFDGRRGRKFTGSLIDIIRETPPEIRRLAAVAALFYSRFALPDGRLVGAPGGFFTASCRRYHRPDAKIPAEVRAWDETGQSLQTMKEALEQGIRHPAQPQLLGLDGNQEATTPSSSYDVPGGTGSRHALPRSWMSRDEAQRLMSRVLREGYAYAITAAVAPDEERPKAYVVVVTWDGWQEPMHSEGEWVQYFTDTCPLMPTIREKRSQRGSVTR